MGVRREQRWQQVNRRYCDSLLPAPERIVLAKTKRKPKRQPSRNAVRSFMADDVVTCKGPTELAEIAAATFGMDGIGGPLDDETHWIWELAADEWARHAGE